ncbi:MAG: LysR family transcriptional regulator [Pseudomonadota bacterium]
MEHWPEFRAAYLVGRLGTVSAASAACGVHRATIIRHIDTLEASLSVKLFHRHRSGYTPTEAGTEFVNAATSIEGHYNCLLGKIRNQAFEVSGEVSVTASAPLSPFIILAAQLFQERFPNCSVDFSATEEFPGLELAETHMVLWAGEQPDVGDYVVVPITEFSTHLYASAEYAEKHGLPQNDAELVRHNFVCFSKSARSEPTEWLLRHLANLGAGTPNIVFQSNCRSSVFRAVINGSGIGLLPDHIARSTPGVVQVMSDLPIPPVPVWAVTHMDTHRSKKTQSFLGVLKEVGRTAHDQVEKRKLLVAV